MELKPHDDDRDYDRNSTKTSTISLSLHMCACTHTITPVTWNFSKYFLFQHSSTLSNLFIWNIHNPLISPLYTIVIIVTREYISFWSIGTAPFCVLVSRVPELHMGDMARAQKTRLHMGPQFVHAKQVRVTRFFCSAIAWVEAPRRLLMMSASEHTLIGCHFKVGQSPGHPLQVYWTVSLTSAKSTR